VLRIGTTGDYAPYSIESGGRLEGADIELATALAAALGVRPVFVRTSWPSLLQDLVADRFDLAAGGVSVTAARRAVGSFSTVYATGGKTIIARCRDASRYSSLAAIDRPQVRVIVNPGGTNQQFVLDQLHRAQVIVHPDNRSVFEELRAGRADVMVTDDVEVELQTRRHPDLCRALPGTLTRTDKALLLPRDPALEARIDTLLAPEIAAGRPARWLAAFIAHAPVDPARPPP
jgi:cyclohexadienyl dehydratase